MDEIFYSGQKVRVKPSAFGGSMELEDLIVRGSVVELRYLMDVYDDGDALWYAVYFTEEGHLIETAPLESELEVVCEA
jgi:hypothetical protein